MKAESDSNAPDQVIPSSSSVTPGIIFLRLHNNSEQGGGYDFNASDQRFTSFSTKAT